MKKTGLTLLGLCFALTVTMGQQSEWMKKYWNYRDRFRKYFVWIGSGEGKSLALANNDPDGVAGYNYWHYGYGINGRGLRWGDCTGLYVVSQSPAHFGRDFETV